MANTDLLDRFETWLLSSDRGDGTIRLRMRHMRKLAARVDLASADTEQLEGILATRRKLAAESRKSILASWRVFYGWARSRGIRVDDPTADIRSIRVPVRVPRIAPDDAIVSALDRATPRDRAMIMLARYACLRLTELTTLNTGNREGDRIRVIGKGDKERIVYLNRPLLEALVALEREQGPGCYFPGGTDGHLHPMSVNKIITRITGWNPHSLRHAGATAAYNATGNLRAVQEMLGHASLATTQRYLHLDEASKRRVAAATVIQLHMPLAA